MSEPDPTGDQHPAQKAAAKLPPWKKRLLITAAALMVLSLAAHAARLIWAEPEAGPTGDLSQRLPDLARPFGAAEPGVDGTGDGHRASGRASWRHQRWWHEIRVLLKFKHLTGPALDEWADRLAKMIRSTLHVPATVIRRCMTQWK